MSPRITFEPIDVEIDCDDDETILDAAFRQGWNLVHGCREGQCTACKSLVLEGDVTLEGFSPDALSESEELQGYTLLCRALPDSDLVIELLHHDADNLRLANPITDGRARIESLDVLTHDMTLLRLRVTEPQGFSFVPGQYVEVWLPGTDGELRRSYSMANLPGDGLLELVVRRYPGGRFSTLLDPTTEDALSVGQELEFTGPYGTMRVLAGDGPVLLVAGGSGVGPVLAVLRELAAVGSRRRIRFFYGARRREDLPLQDEIRRIGEALHDFTFVPVLSEDAWEGATGLVHERALEAVASGELERPAVCTCGPPPMIDALVEALTLRHGVPAEAIAYDRFTTAVEPVE